MMTDGMVENDDKVLYSKYDSPARSVMLELYYPSGQGIRARLVLGYDAGGSVENHTHATNLSEDTWYVICGSYQNSNMATAVRVRDGSGNVIGTDLEETATLDANKISATNAKVMIGARGSGGSPIYTWGGNIDEVVVFKDVLTASEVTQIAQGVYGQ